MPAINSKTKTEAMAMSDNRKAFFFITSTSGLVAVLVVVFERPVTANKNRVEFII